MSNYPESADVFVNKTGSDDIASSDPNNAFDGIEATQGLVGALGKPQSWSTTLMTLMRKYRRDMRVEATGGALYVRAGEAVLENTDGSRLVFRKNTADVTVAAADIDVGSMVIGTYYVYASGGTAATTAPILFSTDAYAPSAIGTAPYRKIGWFYNAVNAALGVTYAGDIKENGNQVNSIVAIGETDITLTSTAYTDMTNMNIPFISNGRPVEIMFNAPIKMTAGGYYASVAIDIDGTDKIESQLYYAAGGALAIPLKWVEILPQGSHTIAVQWKVDGSTGNQDGATYKRILSIKEL